VRIITPGRKMGGMTRFGWQLPLFALERFSFQSWKKHRLQGQ
jgi:hypothetical protein